MAAKAAGWSAALLLLLLGLAVTLASAQYLASAGEGCWCSAWAVGTVGELRWTGVHLC